MVKAVGAHAVVEILQKFNAVASYVVDGSDTSLLESTVRIKGLAQRFGVAADHLAALQFRGHGTFAEAIQLVAHL